MELLAAFVTFGVLFAVVDAVWLKSTSSMYKRSIGALLLEKPKMSAAVVFYIVYVAGVAVLALLPALGENQWQIASWQAAALGFVAYATYDLTNLATLKSWPTKLVVIDIIWGTFATTLAATVSYFILTGWSGL